MEQLSHSNNFKPGVYQGSPDLISSNKSSASTPRLIRTMKTDMAEAVKNQNETVVSIKIAEEKKKAVSLAQARETVPAPTVVTPKAPKPIGRIIVILVILIIISAMGFAYVFILPKLGEIKLPKFTIPSFDIAPSKPSNQVVQPAPKTILPSIIPAQNEKGINIANTTPDKAFDAIGAEMSQGSASGSIKNIYFEESIKDTLSMVSTKRFFDFTGLSIPEILSRSLEEKFMVGLFGETSGKATPFIVLKISDRDIGLAGMLEWEASIPSFFDTVFSTKTSGGSNVKFRDVVIAGKDARMIDSPFINIVIYAFADKNTIVIAGTSSALESLLPLAVSK